MPVRPGAPSLSPVAPSSSSAPSIPSTPIPSGVPTDPRRDMLKELIASQLVTNKADVEATLKAIVTKAPDDAGRPQPKPVEAPSRDPKLNETVKPTPPSSSPASASPSTSAPSSERVQRALQFLQREAGLPVTGKFDDATVNLLKSIGVVPSSAKPAEKAATPAPEPKKPVDPTLKAEARQKLENNADAARLKARMQSAMPTKPSSTEPQKQDLKLDRALDPSRLLASLFAAGFTGSAEKALSSFQAAHGLPPTATLDAKTVDALVAQGHIPSETADAHKHIESAGGQGASTGSAADKAKSDSTRPQAATQSATKAGDLATRAPASTPAEARERARLDSLMAQAAATERGVQEGTGDPTATQGHGETPGASTGVSGAGGTAGGADTGGTEAAHEAVGDAGDEDSVGNAKAGDDDHDDDRRGNASDAVSDGDPDGEVPVGHYRVAKLSEQVTKALEAIARIDDGTVPVHYTWDVTLHRPGVYAEGQPAEALWHLVVERAHAFDPVWQKAQQAIASRLLYVEPDSPPVSLDEILGALRRARVR